MQTSDAQRVRAGTRDARRRGSASLMGRRGRCSLPRHTRSPRAATTHDRCFPGVDLRSRARTSAVRTVARGVTETMHAHPTHEVLLVDPDFEMRRSLTLYLRMRNV